MYSRVSTRICSTFSHNYDSAPRAFQSLRRLLSQDEDARHHHDPHLIVDVALLSHARAVDALSEELVAEELRRLPAREALYRDRPELSSAELVW